MNIRKAAPRDLGHLATLFDQYRIFYGRRPDVELAARFLRERMREEQSTIFVAESASGALAGFTQLYPSISSVAAAATYVLNDLYAAPAHRRRGVGRGLLEAARRFAESTGAVALSLPTGVHNKAAHSLYESLDWVRDREFLHYELVVEANQQG